MTEEEWLAAKDPKSMLNFLDEKASDRKFDFFAVACCYLSHRDDSPCFRVEVLESVVRYRDGLISVEEMRDHWPDNWDTIKRYYPFECPQSPFEWGLIFAYQANLPKEETEAIIDYPTCAELISLIRDIFGNPYRSVALDPSCLSSTVLTLATGIYQDRAFDRMPILADALQDAGCDNADILIHCRSESVHVRGCWVVDLLLGKA